MLRKGICFMGLLAIFISSLLGSQAQLDEHDKRSLAEKHKNKRDIVDPVLMLNVSWNNTQSLSSGDELLYNLCVRHASFSSGDAFNVHLNWFFPSYIKFLGFNQATGPEVNLTRPSSFIQFKVGHLSQHEEVCFDISFVFDPTTSLKPGRHFIVTHAQLSWQDHTEHRSTNTLHTCPFDTFTIQVEIPGCSNELGISNGYIKDHQMTSSSYVPGYEALQAKMDGPNAWCAAVLDQHQFLQIDFIHQVRITKISVRGRNISTQATGVERFVLGYSTDWQKWENYTEYGSLKIFHNTLSEGGAINSHWILDPFEAYGVRIRPTSWNNSMCLAVEFYGCEDKQSSASCNLALGMESGFITDGALTSQNRGNPQAGRLNTKVQGNLHGWLASPYQTDDYLQMDLGVLYQITKIAVQGGWITTTELSQHFVKKYTVMFSNDSQTWLDYTENGEKRVFDGPSNGAMAIYPTFARLTRLLVARFLRIIPQPQDGLRVMRLEIYGCLKEPMPSYPVPKEFARRSCLLNQKTGDFYVCLYRNDRTESSCKKTKDGYSWENLSSRIVNVLAVDLSRNNIYALDRSNIYLVSSDFGGSWVAISPTQWRKIVSTSNLTLTRKIPENLLAEIPMDGEALKSDSGSYWAVSHIGVHMKQAGEDWILAATWKCCTH